MKRSKHWIVVVVVAFVFAFFAGGKSAKACGGGSSYGGSGSSGYNGLLLTAVVIGVGVAATDVGMGIYDVAKNGGGEHTSKGYAIFETSFAGAQSAVIWTAIGASPGHFEWTPTSVALVTVPTLLTLHGILTLSTVDWTAEKHAEMPHPTQWPQSPYAPYAPAPPPASTTNEQTQHDVVPPKPESDFRVRLLPTMLPSGAPGSTSTTMAPGLVAFGVF